MCVRDGRHFLILKSWIRRMFGSPENSEVEERGDEGE